MDPSSSRTCYQDLESAIQIGVVIEGWWRKQCCGDCNGHDDVGTRKDGLW